MSYRTVRIPVRGGRLLLGCWGMQGTPVLAVHGVTSSHCAFESVAEALAGRRLVAPDLRGRGASNGLPGPYGMATHAEDLVRVLDAVQAERAVVVGHSMGGFVAVVLARRFPDRVDRLVLVDGGLPLPRPAGLGPDEALRSLIGPAADRLNRTFASLEEYRAHWRAHPALGPYWSRNIQSYVDYDVARTPSALRSRTRYEAVRDDTADLQAGDRYLTALAQLTHRTTFLRAERGMLDQPRGLYSPEQVDAAVAEHPMMTARTLHDVNHYTAVLGARGAAVVAAAVTEQPAADHIPPPRPGPPHDRAPSR